MFPSLVTSTATDSALTFSTLGLCWELEPTGRTNLGTTTSVGVFSLREVGSLGLGRVAEKYGEGLLGSKFELILPPDDCSVGE